jgi:polyadenylation factor subunit 2
VNKDKAPVNAVAFSPDGRRVTTASSVGEFTMWHGHTFNYDAKIQGHPHAILTMAYTHSGEYLVSGDEGGWVRYWSPSMALQEKTQAHGEAVKGVAIAPSDRKFATCSHDGTVKVWDFFRCATEHTLTGHANNVTAVAWHPTKALVASVAKDNMVKLWDAAGGKEVRNIPGHTSWPLVAAWNDNGWWLVTAGRDNTVRLLDIRVMKPFQTVVSDHKGVTAIAWHPFTERYFVTGSQDGALQHWAVGLDYPQAEVAHAHDQPVWGLAWAPTGAVLASGSSDYATKFWARSRPGDTAGQYAYQGNPARNHAPGNNPNTVPVPPGPAGRGVLPVSALGGGAGAGAAGGGGGGAGGGLGPYGAGLQALGAGAAGAGGAYMGVAGAGGVGALAGRTFAELSYEEAEAAAMRFVPSGAPAATLPGERAAVGPAAAAAAAGGAPVAGPVPIAGGKRPPPGYKCPECGSTEHWRTGCPALLARLGPLDDDDGGGGGGAAAPLLPPATMPVPPTMPLPPVIPPGLPSMPPAYLMPPVPPGGLPPAAAGVPRAGIPPAPPGPGAGRGMAATLPAWMTAAAGGAAGSVPGAGAAPMGPPGSPDPAKRPRV